MARDLTVDEIMAILPETPRRIADLTKGLTPAQLRASPEPGAWSVNDVMAHLRACHDVLGGNTLRILAEDRPVWKGMNPRAGSRRPTIRNGSSRPPSRCSRSSAPTCCAGVVLGTVGSTASDLMRDADVAMYQAKAHGKDKAEVYQAAMHGIVTRRYELGTEIANAIATRAFVLHYQPAIELETGAIVGAEALVRWNHPVRGLIGPGEFISLAESLGLINGLGSWILREACVTAASWPDRPDGQRPAISVNLAASQLLQPGLVDEVAALLAETGLAPDRLILEVTESALVDLAPARDALQRLRGLGVLLALDDFGTGYSALSYLADLPFHIVKIDQSFVAALGQGDRFDAIVEGIIGLCDALDLVTVAEGIEDASQLDRLRGLGCRIGQGYYFARPVRSAEFIALLAAPRPTSRPPEPVPGPARRRPARMKPVVATRRLTARGAARRGRRAGQASSSARNALSRSFQ